MTRRRLPSLLALRSCWLVAALLLATGLAATARAEQMAGVVVIDPAAARVPLNDALGLFVDPSGNLTIDDVAKPDAAARFESPRGDPRNLGHIYSTVWIRFTVRAAAQDIRPRVIELAYPFADAVTLYAPLPGGGFHASNAGDHTKVSDREMPDHMFLFPVRLAPGGDTTFYLRYQNVGLVSLPLSIWRDDLLRPARTREMLLLGGYYGCLFALLLFNLALFAGLRARVYIAYVVYTAAMIFFMATQNGLANLYLYPELPQLADRLNYLSVLIASTSILYFGRTYIGIGTLSPGIDRVLLPLQWLGIGLSAVVVLGPRMLGFWGAMFYGIAVVTGLYSAALYHWLVARSRPAAYVSIAITLPVVGAAFLFLRNFGYFPVNWVTEHGLQIGTMFEMLVLALGLAEQIAVIRREREEARRAAAEDRLTGLGNRSLLEAQLPQIVARAGRLGHRVGVLWIDVDQLKPINDRYGHAAGDALLRAVGERMREVVRGHDLVARVGGDEFVVVAEAVESDEAFTALAARLNASIARPIEHAGITVHASASIGIALYPDHAQTDAELLQRADRAMYDAKAAGRNTWRRAA